VEQEKIEKLTLKNFKYGVYGVYINNVLLVMEIKDIYYEEDVRLVLWLLNGKTVDITGVAWKLQEGIEDELQFKDINDNTIIITNNHNKF